MCFGEGSVGLARFAIATGSWSLATRHFYVSYSNVFLSLHVKRPEPRAEPLLGHTVIRVLPWETKS